MKHFLLQITADKMRLQSLHIIVLLVYSAEVSASLLSLKFVESYMKMYKLNFPMFILHPSDLDSFYEEMTNTTFQTFSCFCYEQGKEMCNIKHWGKYTSTQNLQTKICKE